MRKRKALKLSKIKESFSDLIDSVVIRKQEYGLMTRNGTIIAVIGPTESDFKATNDSVKITASFFKDNVNHVMRRFFYDHIPVIIFRRGAPGAIISPSFQYYSADIILGYADRGRHPGVTIKHLINFGFFSMQDASRKLDVTLNRLNNICASKQNLDADTCMKIANYFNIRPELLMRLQVNYEFQLSYNRGVNRRNQECIDSV